MNLQSLGADASLESAFETYAARGLSLARVARSQRDQYLLFTTEGETPGEPSGALWYRTPDRAGMPVTGDWVAARAAGERAVVEAVLPRKTLFSRRAAGRRDEEQPIAANIDLVFLVSGLDADSTCGGWSAT
jgi:ribosome biogenesis GTPase